MTGATGGIGEGFAEVLAQRGFNVFLISRREAALQELAQQIEAKNAGIKTEILELNCANATAADYQTLNEKLSALQNLSVVINNVGLNTATPNELDSMTEEEVDGMLSVNARFTTKFTKLVLPILKKRDTSVASRAAILHLSSFSGVFPAGLMAVYSATKAFADAFGRALDTELASSRIDSVSIVAHYVVSNMSGFDRPSMSVPTATAFAKTTLNKLGAGSQLIPHWHHDLMARIINLLPSSFVATKTYGMMKAARRALLDPERQKKRAARRKDAEAKKAEERAKILASANAKKST